MTLHRLWFPLAVAAMVAIPVLGRLI